MKPLPIPTKALQNVSIIELTHHYLYSIPARYAKYAASRLKSSKNKSTLN